MACSPLVHINLCNQALVPAVTSPYSLRHGVVGGTPQMADDADGRQPSTSTTQAPQKQPKQYKKLDPVTPDQLAQEELMNNCFVKTVISGVMGSGLGLVFGVFMGAMDSAVSSCCSFPALRCAEKATLQWLVSFCLKPVHMELARHARRQALVCMCVLAKAHVHAWLHRGRAWI